jgi:hypothetical protein
MKEVRKERESEREKHQPDQSKAFSVMKISFIPLSLVYAIGKVSFFVLLLFVGVRTSRSLSLSLALCVCRRGRGNRKKPIQLKLFSTTLSEIRS